MLYQNEGFGDRLRRLREEKSLSQEALAQALFVTRQTISSWERGRTEPDLATLNRISSYFHITLDALLQGAQSEKPTEALKSAALALYVLGLILFGVILVSACILQIGFLPIVFSSAFTVIINTILFFGFSRAIKTGDISWIAGFDNKIAYHIPTVCKLLDFQRFWLILSGVIACIPFVLSIFQGSLIYFTGIIGICFLYIATALFGCTVSEKRLEKNLYIATANAWPKEASCIPLYAFLSSLFVSLFCLGIAVDFVGLDSNSPAAVTTIFSMLLCFGLQLGWFLTEQKRAITAGKNGLPYRPIRRSCILLGSSIFLSLLQIFLCVIT